jgi:tetratricopeptide (TPR) repeat protein
MPAQEAIANNSFVVRNAVVSVLPALPALYVCCQLLFAAGGLNNAAYAHLSNSSSSSHSSKKASHTHSSKVASSKTSHSQTSKAKHKSKHHKGVAQQNTARNIEPKMPSGYHEVSGLAPKAYQLRQLAWSYTAQKNYNAAATNLHQAIALTEQCYGENSKLLLPLYLDLASVEQDAGHPSQTAAALTACLKLDPIYVDASIKLALARLQQGNTGEAMTAGKQALKSAPQDPRTHVLMSLLLAKTGQSSQATEEKNEARKLYKSMPQAKFLPANLSPESTDKTVPTAVQGTQAESQPTADHDNDEPDSQLELP